MQGLTTLSPQLPPPSHPPVPVLLNASNLELLATSDEKNRVRGFVASQARYAKAQANEGRAVRASWDISTPEKERMKLHKHQLSAGFETPVLKPRAVQIQPEPDHEPRPSPPPRRKSPVNKPSVHSPRVAKRGKATAGFTEAVPPERQKRPKNKSTDNKSRSPKAARKERRARSDTDEEHLARLTERRERKRAKREIMNPPKAKASTREDKENEKDAKGGSVEKKKQKIPAGLALMHGFSSTSVGKSRLTMEPPPNFGVFNKGRASAKIKVDGSKRTRQRGHPRIFSEDRLLNSRPANPMTERHSEAENSEASSSSSTGHESSSDKAENLPAVQETTPIKIRETKDRRQPATPRCASEETGSDTDSGHETKLTPPPEPTQSRSPPQSACWVIEQDGCSLPSTSSDVSVPSAKSKAKTAFLDVRTAAWSRILKNPSLGGGAPFPPEYHETAQAVSSLHIPAIVKEVATKALPELEEPASIGPWESASQVARGTLPPQEQKSMYSRFFTLPHSDEPGFAQSTTQPADQFLGRLAGVADNASSDHSANATIDEPLVYGGASMDNRGEDLLPRATIISPPEHTPTARETVNLPDNSVSVLRTPSLDSIERALLDVPEVTYHPSQIRRRSVQRRNFSPTSQSMIFDQYGLGPIDNRCKVPRLILRDDGYSEPGYASPLLGNSVDVGIMQYCAPSLRGGDGIEEPEGYIEDTAGCHKYHTGVMSDPHDSASDMVYTQPNASDEWQNEALFFTSEEGIGYDEMSVGTKECCDDLDSASMAPVDSSALPEGDVGRVTNIRLWDDEAWPREEAVGSSMAHEVSHLTAVQKVERDVARKLKGHWFPHKF